MATGFDAATPFDDPSLSFDGEGGSTPAAPTGGRIWINDSRSERRKLAAARRIKKRRDDLAAALFVLLNPR